MMAISSSNTRLLAMVLVNTVPVFTASLVLHTRLAPLDNHRPVLSARSRLQPHQPPLHLPPRLGVLLSQRLDLSPDGCPNLVEAASEIPVQLIEPRLQGVIALPLLSQPLTGSQRSNAFRTCQDSLSVFMHEAIAWGLRPTPSPLHCSLSPAPGREAAP